MLLSGQVGVEKTKLRKLHQATFLVLTWRWALKIHTERERRSANCNISVQKSSNYASCLLNLPKCMGFQCELNLTVQRPALPLEFQKGYLAHFMKQIKSLIKSLCQRKFCLEQWEPLITAVEARDRAIVLLEAYTVLLPRVKQILSDTIICCKCLAKERLFKSLIDASTSSISLLWTHGDHGGKLEEMRQVRHCLLMAVD